MKRYEVDLEVSIKGITKVDLARYLNVKPSVLEFIKKKNLSRIYRISSNCDSYLPLNTHIEALLSRFDKSPFKKIEGIEVYGLLIGIFSDIQIAGFYIESSNLLRFIKKFPESAIEIRSYFCDKAE